MKRILSIIFLAAVAQGGHYIIPGHMPYDAYHDLHLPHNPPLHPTFARVPPTSFSCENRISGYYADIEAGCQVTGSNKGIGFGIVKGLCEKFDGVVYLTARDSNRGEAAIEELEKLKLHPKFHQLDITDDESVNRFRDFIKEKHGGVDILVNNAGIAFKVNSKEPFNVQAKETMKVNYFGTVRISNALFPLLRPHARVVNVSSSCGHLSKIPSLDKQQLLSNPELTEAQLTEYMQDFINSAEAGTNVNDGWGTSAYNVSKVGVSALSFIQQRELDREGRKDIVVNAVHPGYVDTDMTSHKGDWTIDQGSDAPLFLAMLPPNEKDIRGAYVWKDRRVIDWRAPEAPARY